MLVPVSLTRTYGPRGAAVAQLIEIQRQSILQPTAQKQVNCAAIPQHLSSSSSSSHEPITRPFLHVTLVDSHHITSPSTNNKQHTTKLRDVLQSQIKERGTPALMNRKVALERLDYAGVIWRETGGTSRRVRRLCVASVRVLIRRRCEDESGMCAVCSSTVIIISRTNVA